MTPAQVVVAAKGRFFACDPVKCRGQVSETSIAKLVGTYRAGNFSFRSFAMFDKRSNKLVQISLQLLQPEHGAELVGAVRSKYGEPATKSLSSIMSLWVWRDKKDQISIVEIGSGPSANVSLSYQPRLSDENNGL